MGRRRHRSDLNQVPLVKAIRALPQGFVVHITSSLGEGFPDWVLVGPRIIGGYETVLVEVKSGPNYRLTEDEEKFHARWPGTILIVWEVDQVLRYYGWID